MGQSKINQKIYSDPEVSSSDYLLDSLGIDMAYVQKRLGDGFYEQRLIRDQIAQLTGRRFLGDYRDDDEQYQALMDNGISYAKSHQLRPGIELTPEQIAELTTDMVWLVEQDVTLADGSVQKVLVPKVYALLHDGDLKPSGALISGNDVHLNLTNNGTGSLTNLGTVAGRNLVDIHTDTLNNIGGNITAAMTKLNATGNINNIGGTVQAETFLSVKAAGDLNLQSTTSTQHNTQGSRTNIDRVAGLYVTQPNGWLVASAGGDINLKAANIINQGRDGQTLLIANNINLETLNTAKSDHFLSNTQHQTNQHNSQTVGSRIQTEGDLSLIATNNIQLRAATLISQDGDINARAGNNIRIDVGHEQNAADASHQFSAHRWLGKT
ncbi:partial filamentous hemagglutinin, partial [uncultured bacterium]